MPLLSLAFLLSGFSGLLYQIVWQRMIAPFAGSDVLSATLVVSSFMGGLGIGSLIGGHLAARWSRRGQLVAFAIVEAGVAVCALVSADVLYDGLYRSAGAWSEAFWVRAVVVTGVLLPPTVLMGMSLPLLSAAAAAGRRDPARIIGGLYGWNTLGAALGALLTVWVIFRATDQRTALALGAALTLVAAAVALVVAWRTAQASDAIVPTSDDPPRATVSLPLAAWIALFALSGFVALSLEILWFRVLGVVVKSNATTFGTLLAIYLAGIGLGALLARRGVKQPSAPVLLLAMAAVPCYAALALAGLHAWAEGGGAVLSTHVARYDPWDLARVGWIEFLYVHALVPFALIGPPTLAMGVTFVWLQRAAQTDPHQVGIRVGWLQAANLSGAVAGAAVTGLIAMDLLGTTGVMKTLVASAAVPAGLAVWLIGPRRLAPSLVLVAAVLAAIGCAVPEHRQFWQALHGAAGRGFLVDEDRTGIAAVRDETYAGKIVFTNGLGQSRLPYGGIHVTLGAVPTLAHPNPRRVLIIGLGSGATLFGAAGRAETERLDVVELVEPQQRLLRTLKDEYGYPALLRLIDDPRITWRTGDGRAFLHQTSTRYDVIEADALRPTSPYSGLLYSREYFELVRSRLAAGGLAVTWNPTPRVASTFRAVFLHVAIARDVLIGSNEPIALDLNEIAGRATHPTVQAHFAHAGLDPLGIVRTALEGVEYHSGGASPSHDLNEDLFPRDEFRVPHATRGPTSMPTP